MKLRGCVELTDQLSRRSCWERSGFADRDLASKGIGATSSWRQGENVIEVLASGRKIAQGIAIATFVDGRYPDRGHRHAALFLRANTSCSHSPKTGKCSIMSIRIMDQWNAQPGAHYHKDTISGRDLKIYGQSKPEQVVLGAPVGDGVTFFGRRTAQQLSAIVSAFRLAIGAAAEAIKRTGDNQRQVKRIAPTMGMPKYS